MESAIAPHLRCPRTRQRGVGDDYAPAFPGYAAYPDAPVRRLVLGHFGVQASGAGLRATAWAALRAIIASFTLPDGPGHHELAFSTDEVGHDNFMALAYWNDPDAYTRWSAHPSVASRWTPDAPPSDGLGHFREILIPRVERFESLLSDSDRLEGAGVMLGRVSPAPIREHGYWGSSRDRIPDSQVDAMQAAGTLTRLSGTSPKGSVRVAGHENLVFIRSGQDWADAGDKERELYLGGMERALHRGMDFLARKGHPLGCYASRHMRHIDANGLHLDKGFGMAFWRSLAHLEHWAAAHPTHKAIVGAFPPVAKAMNFDLKLRLFHEIAVLRADEQFYEYLNCHPGTGLGGGLAALEAHGTAVDPPVSEHQGKPAMVLPGLPAHTPG